VWRLTRQGLTCRLLLSFIRHWVAAVLRLAFSRAGSCFSVCEACKRAESGLLRQYNAARTEQLKIAHRSFARCLDEGL